MKLAFASGLASTIVALAPICSHASDLGETMKAAVNYADLDLNTDAGARTLYHRLTKAADEVCPADSSTFEQHRIYKTCVKAAMSAAVRDVNREGLSKIYAARTGITVEPQLSMNR
jgi:UrcA family protein